MSHFRPLQSPLLSEYLSEMSTPIIEFKWFPRVGSERCDFSEVGSSSGGPTPQPRPHHLSPSSPESTLQVSWGSHAEGRAVTTYTQGKCWGDSPLAAEGPPREAVWAEGPSSPPHSLPHPRAAASSQNQNPHSGGVGKLTRYPRAFSNRSAHTADGTCSSCSGIECSINTPSPLVTRVHWQFVSHRPPILLGWTCAGYLHHSTQQVWPDVCDVNIVFTEFFWMSPVRWDPPGRRPLEFGGVR